MIDRNALEPFISAAGFENWGCQAQAPRETADEQGFPAYVFQVRARVLESAS